MKQNRHFIVPHNKFNLLQVSMVSDHQLYFHYILTYLLT